MEMKKKLFTFCSDLIFSKHYFYTLFIGWLCRLFGSFPALGVSEKEFIISFYASYDLFLKPSWPDFLFFTFNLSEFLFFSIFFIWHNFSFLNFVMELWTKRRLIDLSGSAYGLCSQYKCFCWKMGSVPLTFHIAAWGSGTLQFLNGWEPWVWPGCFWTGNSWYCSAPSAVATSATQGKGQQI